MRVFVASRGDGGQEEKAQESNRANLLWHLPRDAGGWHSVVCQMPDCFAAHGNDCLNELCKVFMMGIGLENAENDIARPDLYPSMSPNAVCLQSEFWLRHVDQPLEAKVGGSRARGRRTLTNQARETGKTGSFRGTACACVVLDYKV